MSHKCRMHRQQQSGQSVIEFMIAALFVLVPAIYMVVHLGKVGDLQHRAYEGARYSVWEAAKTQKSSADIQNEVNKRIFYQDYKELNSVTDRTDNASTAKLEPLYTHRGDDGTREAFVMLKNGTYNTASNVDEAPGGAAGTRTTLVTHGVASTLRFKLNDEGMVTSTIEMTTSKSKYLDGLSVHPHAWNTMFVEAWRKVTPGSVKSAVHDSLAINTFSLDSVVAPLTTLGSLLGMPEWAGFDPGHVAPDITSCSRVVGGGSSEAAC